MKISAAITLLDKFDQKNHFVFHNRDLRRLFRDSDSAFKQSLIRLMRKGTLERAVKDVYVCANSMHRNHRTIEFIASALRKSVI